jgi:hypothetical protein
LLISLPLHDVRHLRFAFIAADGIVALITRAAEVRVHAILMGVEWTAPGYMERVWNLGALSGVSVGGVPLEELLFAAVFGAYWSAV